jgi:hypothetical protein
VVPLASGPSDQVVYLAPDAPDRAVVVLRGLPQPFAG